MYKPYLELPQKHFPNTLTIVDSFHVTQFLLHRINKYIYSVLKRYREKRKGIKKEKFIAFNHSNFNSEEDIIHTMNKLINEFKASEIDIFIEFAYFLERYQIQYARSFQTMLVHRSSINDVSNHYSRLNNSYMESMNRKPKDYKRNTRGSTNFNYTRNRILWSTRDNPAILAIPKTSKEVHSYKGRKRRPYNKK